MGPYPQQQPPYYPPPPPFQPQGRTDGKSIAALVLGILSIFGAVCYGGLLFGALAIVLGILARKDIERSGGLLDGAGLATGGIVTGGIGAFMAFAWIGLTVAGVVSGINAAKHAASSPTFTPPPSLTTTPIAPSLPVTTSVRVIDLTASGKLRDQLIREQRAATARGETVLVQTTATWCGVCGEVNASLGDPEMEAALRKVALVRVDMDRYEAELRALKMYEGSVPWFYLIDSTGRPTDRIASDEWDDNIPENMAPVLGAFVQGTLTKRRHPANLGTSL